MRGSGTCGRRAAGRSTATRGSGCGRTTSSAPTARPASTASSRSRTSPWSCPAERGGFWLVEQYRHPVRPPVVGVPAGHLAGRRRRDARRSWPAPSWPRRPACARARCEHLGHLDLGAGAVHPGVRRLAGDRPHARAHRPRGHRGGHASGVRARAASSARWSATAGSPTRPSLAGCALLLLARRLNPAACAQAASAARRRARRRGQPGQLVEHRLAAGLELGVGHELVRRRSGTGRRTGSTPPRRTGTIRSAASTGLSAVAARRPAETPP